MAKPLHGSHHYRCSRPLPWGESSRAFSGLDFPNRRFVRRVPRANARAPQSRSARGGTLSAPRTGHLFEDHTLSSSASHQERDHLRLVYLHYLTGDDTANHHVRQFADAARELGHKVDVVGLRQRDQSRSSTGPRATHRLREATRQSLSRYLREPKELLSTFYHHRRELQHLRRERPDVLLVRSHPLIASPSMTAGRLGLPLVLEVNAPRAEALAYDLEHWHVPVLPHFLESLQLRRADAIVTVSTALRDHLAERHRLNLDRFVVAPNGADVSLFRPDEAPEPGLSAWRSGATVIGFVGSFERWHGVDLLAAMTLEVAAARPDTRFLYVGAGPELPTLAERTAVLGERVRLAGPVPHGRVPGLVAAFDVAVMPESNFYGSPLKVLEWMAAGKAIVAPGYRPLAEVVEHEREGLLFEPRNAGQLETSVLRLIDDPELRQWLGAEAARRVREQLTWQHNAKRVLTACRLALSGRAR
jgi:glycosyltransferase involved in cell wall biosynthesis